MTRAFRPDVEHRRESFGWKRVIFGETGRCATPWRTSAAGKEPFARESVNIPEKLL